MGVENEENGPRGSEDWKTPITADSVIETGAEKKTEGSTLATSFEETIIFNMDSRQVGGPEMSQYWLRPEGDTQKSDLTRRLGDIFNIEEYKGEYTAMNGYIAYIPNIEAYAYCLVVDNAENREKIKSAGYKSTTDIGVINFNGGETLEPVTAVANIEFTHAQVELMKAIQDLERKKSELESVKNGEESALKYLGPIEKATTEVEKQQLIVKDLREKVKRIAADKQWGARTELP